MDTKGTEVEIGGLYWYSQLLCIGIAGVIKVTGLGKKIPQRVFGELFDHATGEFSSAGDADHMTKGVSIFAAQIRNRLTPEEITCLIREAQERLASFLDTA